MAPRQTIADRAQYRRFVDAVKRLSTSENVKAFEEKLHRIARAQNKVFERTENSAQLAQRVAGSAQARSAHQLPS